MFQMMGVFAEFERAMIQERVRAGLARARGEGKRLRRPPLLCCPCSRLPIPPQCAFGFQLPCERRTQTPPITTPTPGDAGRSSMMLRGRLLNDVGHRAAGISPRFWSAAGLSAGSAVLLAGGAGCSGGS
jgi:hypothetical protein